MPKQPKTTNKKLSKKSTNVQKRNYRGKRKVPKQIIPLSIPKLGFEHKIHKGTLDYKNVRLLRQYLTKQGKILSRKKTKLTAKQQRQVAKTIKTSRVMALLPFVRR